MDQQMTRPRAGRDDIRRELAALAHRLAASESERAAQAAHIALLLDKLAERAADWERVHDVLRAREAEVEQLRAALARVHRSFTWRLTRPVRAAGRRLALLRPPPPRREADAAQRTAAAEAPPERPVAFRVHAEPDVSILIPTYGDLESVRKCLRAVMNGSGARWRYEVIVADDNPEQPVAEILAAETPGLRVIANRENLGFLRSCNKAAAEARGRFLVLLNDDAFVHEGWLDPLVRLADSDPLIGMIGCKLLNLDGTLQEAGGAILSDGWGRPYGADEDPARPEFAFVRDVDVAVGACLLVRRDAFQTLGGFDERYAPAYYEEFDLAFAMRAAGLRVVYQPESVVTHLRSGSYGPEVRDALSLRNHGRFREKWAALLADQPGPDAPDFVTRRRPPSAGAVLMIDDRVPEPDRNAGAVTMTQYMTLLMDMGFAVSFAPAADMRAAEPYATALRQAGVELVTGPGALTRWLAENGAHLRFVWSARPDVTLPLLPAIRAASDAPVLYYTHDLHHLRTLRQWELEGDPALLEESRRLRVVEHAVFAGVDAVMTPSTAEAAIISAAQPDAKVHVIPPFIVASAPRAAVLAGRDRDRIVFVGGFRHPPNADAALWLIESIMPAVWEAAPEARVLIAGDEPPDRLLALAGPRIEVAGWVPDLAPIYARARMSVSPLRYGAGVKGKIIGAIEAGVPVVATSVSNEGIGLIDGLEALVADSAEAFAGAILSLWRDPARAAELAGAAGGVLRRYAPEAAAAALRGAMDLFQCRVCGAQGLARREARCSVCSADETVLALADALLAAYRIHHESSVRGLEPRLRGLRAHGFGALGPLGVELARLPGWTSSAAYPGTDGSGAALELDLLIGRAPTGCDVARFMRDGFEMLKQGGRMMLLDSGTDAARAAAEARFDIAGEGPGALSLQRPTGAAA